jgi:hypothetical protein
MKKGLYPNSRLLKLFFNLLFLFLFSLSFSYAQFNTSIDAGPDVSICQGQSVQLNAVIGSGSQTGCQQQQNTNFNCQNCNQSVSGNSNADVNTGQKVCVLANTTFSGNINLNGGTLVICGTATPQNVNFNSGHIIVLGSATFNNLNTNNSSSSLKNYGTLTLHNFTFNGTFENHGTATKNNDFNVNSGATFINTGTLTVSNNFNNNSSVTNSGTITVNGALQNNGSGNFSNNCTVNTNGNFFTGGIFNNNGSLSAGNYTYSWLPTIGLSNPNIKNPLASPSATTNYVVTVLGPNGFSKKDTVKVTVGNSDCIPSYQAKPGIFGLNAVQIDTATGQLFIPPMYVYDRFGDSIAFDDIRIPNNSEIAGIFRLHFFDDDNNTGVGFDNNTVQGDAMRAVVVQVFTDLSHLLVNGGLRTNLPNPFPTDPTSQHFVEIRVTSYLTNTADVAKASSYYLEGGPGGIANGSVWKAITTGYDPYSELGNTIFGPNLPPATPAGDHYHGFLEVNRFYSFYTNLSNTTTAPGQFDLYSVTLHEVLHMLGITTVVDQNGDSRLKQGYYSPYDALITNSSNIPVFTNNHCYSLQYSGVNLTAGCNTLFFNGPNLSNQEIHTPSLWDNGSSIGHFNCNDGASCPASFQTNGYVMNYCSEAGAAWVRRTLHPNEVRALYDLGYHITNTYGAGTPGVDLGSNSSAGARTYTIAGDKSMAVAGTNDFRPYNSSNTGAAYTIQAGQTLTFVGYLNQGPNAILVNDNDFDNFNQQGNLKISCIEILLGRGGVTSVNITNVTSTSFSYTPPLSFSGQAVIRYRPENQFGQRGNITYVFINVTSPPLPACVRTQADCNNNLVCYGGFEEFNNAFLNELPQFFIDGASNSADLFRNGQNVFFSSLGFGAPLCCNVLGYMGCGNSGGSLPLAPEGIQYIGSVVSG